MKTKNENAWHFMRDVLHFSFNVNNITKSKEYLI